MYNKYKFIYEQNYLATGNTGTVFNRFDCTKYYLSFVNVSRNLMVTAHKPAFFT